MWRNLLKSGLLLWTALLLCGWTANFQPEELGAAPDLTSSVASIEWAVKAATALAAIAIYIFAGKRAASGDYTGACLSFAGSTLIAISPYLFIGV